MQCARPSVRRASPHPARVKKTNHTQSATRKPCNKRKKKRILPPPPPFLASAIVPRSASSHTTTPDPPPPRLDPLRLLLPHSTRYLPRPLSTSISSSISSSPPLFLAKSETNSEKCCTEGTRFCPSRSSSSPLSSLPTPPASSTACHEAMRSLGASRAQNRDLLKGAASCGWEGIRRGRQGEKGRKRCDLKLGVSLQTNRLTRRASQIH